MKTFKFSLVLRTRENTDVFISLDDTIYGIHSKRVNILYLLPLWSVTVVWCKIAGVVFACRHEIWRHARPNIIFILLSAVKSVYIWWK